MAAIQFHQFPYMSDNYGVLLHDGEAGITACVDCGDADAVLQALASTGWKLDQIFITHHHADHTAGLDNLKASTGAMVIGPGNSSSSLAGIDKSVADGDSFQFGNHQVNVIHTPGHTMDMLNYYLPEANVVFTGDTLFAMGCGRLFEGDAETMFNSLAKIRQLPAETIIYCSHEYTETNGSFAESIDPANTDLKTRMQNVRELRAQNKPTIPTTLAQELATNPFLRATDEGIRKHLGMESASDVEVFAELRSRRDNH